MSTDRNVEGVLRGFGMTLDLETGRMRNWYVDREGVQRWADDDTPKESANGCDE
jgi:hypothetical protein